MKVRGFTLIELLVTIAVLGLVLAAALPSFRAAIQNNRVTTQANELSTAFMLARSEAIKLTQATAICGSTDSASCGGAAAWANGYIVFVDQNRNGVRDAATEPLLRVFQIASGGIAFTGAPALVRYLPSGEIDSAVAVNFGISIPECSGEYARTFQIPRTGRVQVARASCT